MNPLPALALLAALTSLACIGGPEREGRPALLNLDRTGLALDGYDPVAYFAEGGGAPAQGRERFTLVHEGATYRFASRANLDRFRAEPERYEPRYGGWCAWAMVEGERVAIDPESFLVTDEGLLLFYDSFFADTRARWLARGHAELVPQADARWAELLEGNDTGRDQRQP